MCAEHGDTLELYQQALRSELKAWEHEFAEANEGRKAGKDDIKKDVDIAAKYKEYNKLRAKLCNPNDATKGTPRRLRKRKSDASEYHTSQHPAVLDPYDVPASMITTPRAIRTRIGPTPQRNGQVLGLFDMLSPCSTRVLTPSKLKATHSDLLRTPSRHGEDYRAQQASRGGTPSKSVKRRRLDTTQTPTSQRQQVLAALTPVSNRLNKTMQASSDQTPAFLKRYSEASLFVNSETPLGEDLAYSPPRMRLPRKAVGRSLSQLVQSLREQEDEKLDEELALMREIETGEAPPPPRLLVQDSHIGDLPLGADGEHDLSEDELPKDNAGPRRLWKKKGQKRTTRRANIGVNRAKWKPEAEWNDGNEDDDCKIPETQAAHVDGEDHAKDEHGFQSKEKAKPKSTKGKIETVAKGAEGKKRRKINPNATSHANFRSLKLRNKNSKGRSGGRFGRR